MKKLLLFFAVMLSVSTLLAQTTTLTFTGRDANNHFIPLNRVVITNLTKGWQETIYYPDTILVMSSVGIEDYGKVESFNLSQNSPNPFDGTSDFSLCLPKDGQVSIEVYDLNGKKITSYNNTLSAGCHVFRVLLSTAQSYFLTARSGNDQASIKMVNTGNAGSNALLYIGEGNMQPLSVTLNNDTKGESTQPFTFGDMMEYVGYAIINGQECESQRISQQQGSSQSFILQFSAIQALPPTVTTTAVSSITQNSATTGGNVTSDGGANVIVRGVCWGTNQNPTTADSHTTDGSGIGSFTSSLTGLTMGITYYVRAYATNSVGTAYGEQQSFTTTEHHLPTVVTTAVTDITQTTATCGGNVTSDGGTTVTARGVCWSTNTNPTVNDNHTTDGSGIGVFSSSITGLTANTTYYVRAYATNSVGVAYGNEETFVTLTETPVDGQPCPGNATLTDIDGNVYNTVQIGSQCWMKENLRTTRYADGDSISLPSDSWDYYTAYRLFPNDESGNVETFGYLYNLRAVMDNYNSPFSTSNPSNVQGICPNGWHVPSDAEFMQLKTYLMSQSQYWCNSYNSFIAKSLASTSGWSPCNTNLCAIGYNQPANNLTGFTAVPAGIFDLDYQNDFLGFGSKTVFWTSSLSDYYGCNYYDDNVFIWELNSNSDTILRSSHDYTQYNFYSIRCISNGGRPSVTTSAVGNVTSTSAICGGNVTYSETNVTDRGICYNTTGQPSISDNCVHIGMGNGEFSQNLSGLSTNTTYYVRAYAINNVGVAYGDVASFTTWETPSCPGAATVTDYDGNVYNTVQIGQQCWMKENLKVTHFADGTSISVGIDTSTNTAYCYYPNNHSSNVNTFGYLYNWKAVMKNSTSSSCNPSGVQGVCPNGWHVPSNAEWMQLADYASSQSQYICGSDVNHISKALASSTNWYCSPSCYPGDDPSTNNKTGFSGVPAGYVFYLYEYDSWSHLYDVGGFRRNAVFWSSSQSNNTHAYNWLLEDTVKSTSKIMGLSVRCIRDDGRPTVTTSTVVNITLSSATCGGNVTADEGNVVTARGVCWSTSPNPTISDNHTTDGTGMGSFTSNITGLTTSTIYYVRAYATNSAGTAYGEQQSFRTSAQPCPNAATLTDVDGNVYNTVQIGQQCWMKQNLRTTHYADGTSISLGSSTSTTTAYRYYPNNNSSNVATYGYLYNWKAVMHNSYSSSSNPSGVQGVCPNGWHVPSHAEWTQLTDYVRSQSQHVCGDNYLDIAKALASTTGWNSSWNTCAVGNNPSTNNATGFSALPAGCYYYGGYANFGYYAYVWSSKGYDSFAVYRSLSYNNPSMNYNGEYLYYGFSVRCVKD